MHYHKSKFLRFANAAFEFLLLILTFIFAGWLRSYTPMGSQFFMWDIWTFLPISALYALVIVGCNAVLGSYRTLHLRNSIKQLFLIALTSLMGLALMATAFYVFRVSQLSRLLLVYYYLLSVIMIYLKRLVFDRLADVYVRKHDIVPRALLIGGGHISYYLAKSLAGMGVRLRIIELDAQRCVSLSDKLDGAMVINADGTDQEVLDSENVGECGALICLTDRDEENIIAGMYGARRGAKKVIVKVNRLNTLEVMEELGIESVVSPKVTTANAILRSVRALNNSQNSVVEKVYGMLNGKVEAYEFTALEGARYLNIPLSRLNIRPGVLVSVLVRSHHNIIPFGGDHIEAGDTVILTAKAGTVVNLEDAFDLTQMKK